MNATDSRHTLPSSTAILLAAIVLLFASAVMAQERTLTLDVTPPDAGTTTPPAGTHTYDDGEVVTITATPNPGYRFDRWEGDIDEGTEYFVNKQGSDANNGTSKATAFLTIQKGVDALEPGDTLTIGPGEYFEYVKREDLGNAELDTLIRAEVPGTTVLRGDVPAPEFTAVDGYRFVYAGPFDYEPRAVLDHNNLHTFFPKANVAELEFDPGFFHYDENAGMLYISNPDLSAPDQGRYTVSRAADHGLELTHPQRVTLDGLAGAGFDIAILMFTPESCVVRNCVLYMNVGGIMMEAPDGVSGTEGGSNNVVENCVAYGNTFAGITRYSANNDIVRNCHTYLNVREDSEHFGVIHYGTMYGPFLMQNNISWGHNFNFSVKSGGQQELLENSVGLGFIRINNGNVSHNLIAGSNEYDRSSQAPADSILFLRETALDQDFEFADPNNLDFHLQSDSRFIGTAPDGSDRGPYQYEPNIFYVSPTGNDSADGLSMRNPWQTLAHAFSSLNAGDTVYISEGQYAAAPLNGVGDGTEPIRILGRNRETVVISGLQSVTGGAGIVFERLDFDGGVALSDTNDATFKNCTFFGAADGLSADGVDGLKVTHSVFADASLRATGCSEVMLSGNVYANNVVHAVCLDALTAIRYSDYNGYQGTADCWEVDSATWSLADVQQHQDVYSLMVTPTLATVADVPRMESDPALASAGPNDTALGIYYEYDITPKTLDLVGPFVHSVSDTTANLEWWTSHPASCRLEWGETEALGNTVWGYSGSGRFSTFSLTGLSPGQTYYFKIVSADATSSDDTLAVLYPTDPPLSFTTAAAPAAALTYYVAPDGDDANDGLSRGAALKTICRAAGLVGPGDTVLIAEGDYPETVRIRTAGTETRPITFRCITGEKPVLQLAYLPRSFELITKPDIHFDGLYFDGQDMWREGFVLRESPRVQITRCMDTMVTADLSPDLLVKNCIIAGGWSAVGIGRSEGSIIENNVIVGTILRDVSASSAVTVRRNIFCDCIRNKMHQTLTEMSDDVTESDNCFYALRPETDKLAVSNLELPIFRYQTGSNSVATNPMMPDGLGWFQGWGRVSSDEFDECWTANPDLILRDIGLQQSAFADFVFDPPTWPYTLAWATDFVADRDAAEAYEDAGQDADALAAYNDMLATHEMCERLKSEILKRASLCAQRLSDYTQAMQLAEEIPLAPLTMHRQMQIMLEQGQYAALLAAFSETALGGRDFLRSYIYPEHEDVAADLYYYRALAYIDAGDLVSAEADLRAMNDKREELSYTSGVAIHDQVSLRLGNFYRNEMLDDDLALAEYLAVCDRTTWESYGTVDKGVLSGAYESLELATAAACEIYRARGDEQSAADLEASLAQAQADAAAAVGN